ncbi:MAG: uroporphyrinogen-III decarboxylase-like protein [Lentisphaerae bacterium]|nr:uroporphyrinogen-III decarboxylase-like protein [Lentisphaerota bacterium]
MRKPDFDNLLAVMNREKPSRPTLFEFFLNEPLYEKLTGIKLDASSSDLDRKRRTMLAYEKAGYDYVTLLTGFRFDMPQKDQLDTKSLNDSPVIYDRSSFEAYDWKSPEDFDYSVIDLLGKELPGGMKFIGYGPCGVMENLVAMVGFDNLCFMLADDPELVCDITDAIGSRLVAHYKILGQFDSVGAMISNDDCGFKTQPMISPDDMRRYIIPWHREIVRTIHEAGRPAILHSCGDLSELMDDIIDDIGFEAKHSFEDCIERVEDAYERWGDRIAILGGIDVDFICRQSPEAVRKRSLEMLERAEERGGYALGSGNSIPEYVPDEGYLAMISAALER